MAYDIGNVDVVKLDAYMEARDVLRLLREHEDDLPEGCFLHDMRKPAELLVESDVSPKHVRLPNLRWCGEGSGHAFHLLVGEWRYGQRMKDNPVGRAIKGTVDAILTWEGGDSHSGLRIRDGVVTQPKVKMTLEEE